MAALEANPLRCAGTVDVADDAAAEDDAAEKLRALVDLKAAYAYSKHENSLITMHNVSMDLQHFLLSAR